MLSSAKRFGQKVSEFVVLPLCPEILDWVHLRRIQRQEFQLDGASLAVGVVAHQLTAADLQTIQTIRSFLSSICRCRASTVSRVQTVPWISLK